MYSTTEDRKARADEALASIGVDVEREERARQKFREMQDADSSTGETSEAKDDSSEGLADFAHFVDGEHQEEGGEAQGETEEVDAPPKPDIEPGDAVVVYLNGRNGTTPGWYIGTVDSVEWHGYLGDEGDWLILGELDSGGEFFLGEMERDRGQIKRLQG